jgi:predicted RNase H-like HicB family nuclease
MMSLNEQLWSEAEKLASRDYDVETFRDQLTTGELVILAKHPELPGCMAHGKTLDDALANLREARIEYIYSLLEDGLEIPYPRIGATSTTFSDEYVGFEQRIIVGFGTAMDKLVEPDSGEENIAFSYRGDFVERS